MALKAETTAVTLFRTLTLQLPLLVVALEQVATVSLHASTVLV